MREQRYIFQGGIVLLFVIANMICSGLATDLVSSILPKSISEPNKLGLQILSGVILAIAISPSLGYLIYTLRHAIFLATGGWSGLYKRNGIKPFIDKCPDIIHVDNLDVKASLYFCTDEAGKEYVEWIRRRMDAYLISTSISLEIIITNLTFYLTITIFNMRYNMNRLISLWGVSIFFIVVLLYIASLEKKKGVEGFKLFFARVANSSSEQSGDDNTTNKT